MSLPRRLLRFLSKPRREKVVSIRYRFKRMWSKVFPKLPLPVRLPYGGWWLAWNDAFGDALFIGTFAFEDAESRFVSRFLKEGMTILDIGSHNGFYTILASGRVGSAGLVIAFEPSPRERHRLLRNLEFNRCCNVKVEASAVCSARYGSPGNRPVGFPHGCGRVLSTQG
jgi:hypothetical protein